MIGKTIRQYRIVEKLGEGGMGVVYKALDTKLERFVALKFLSQETSISAVDQARFLQEARAASAISHPNVCVIYDIAEDEGQQFIVMEYVDGKTLRRMVPIEKVQDALGYAIQVGEALAGAHAKGIVHRDIKTDNIMVNVANQVKVMDFGLAKLRGSMKLTKTSSTMGTLSYMAPEQIEGGEVDARSDIFSFGVVLYEMLAGQLPFVGEHEAAMMYSILNESPQPIQRFRPELSSEVLHILNRALEKDPGERYQSVREMVIDLRRAKKDSDKVTRTALADIPAVQMEMRTHEQALKIPSPEAKKVPHKKLVLGFSAILVVCVVIVSIFIVTKKPTKPIPAIHRQITFTGKVGVTSISPDANFIAYASRVSQTEGKVYVQDLAGGQPVEIFKDRSVQELRWSPDGSEILIGAGTDSTWGSYIVPRLGGAPRRVLSSNTACWSPDGSRLALNRSISGKRIRLMNRTTGDTTSFSLRGAFTWLYDVEWSPAGGLLLFRTVGQERYTVWTIGTDGSGQSKVVEDSVLIFSPRFSSKGDAIYYLRSRGQTNDLMKIKIDRSRGRAKNSPVVIQTGLLGGTFSISKDNRHLLYARRQGYSNLWLASYENGEIQTKQLTEGSSQVSWPCISPDGEKIAFDMGNALETNIFVMPIDGGKMEQVTFFNSYNSAPVWSPDGKEIAFGSTQGGVPRVWRVNSNGGSPRPFRKSELSTDAFILAWAPCSNILYQTPGNRNYHILNPETEEERPLVGNDSVGWMFGPLYSPDCKKVATWWNRSKRGAWLISLEDSSQTLLAPGRVFPIEWSSDGNWVYASDRRAGETQILMLEARGNRVEKFLTMPFEQIGSITMRPDGKKIVCVLNEAQSDAWLLENFDPEVKP